MSIQTKAILAVGRDDLRRAEDQGACGETGGIMLMYLLVKRSWPFKQPYRYRVAISRSEYVQRMPGDAAGTKA